MTAESITAPLSGSERSTLLRLARDAISASLAASPEPRLHDAPPALREPCGVFVTLHQEGSLRGCIGTLEARHPLWLAVVRMAVAAAFDDTRFPRLTAEELDRTEIEISRLTPPQPCRPEDVVPGRHGVCVVRGAQRGVFLPQVATTYGWDRVSLLREVCRKASLPLDAWKAPGAELFVFEAEQFSDRDAA